MVVPFEDNKYNTKEIYLFEVFCTYMCLNCYKLCEPIYLIYHTPWLYDFLQQPCCILNMEIELPDVSGSVNVIATKSVTAHRK